MKDLLPQLLGALLIDSLQLGPLRVCHSWRATSPKSQPFPEQPPSKAGNTGLAILAHPGATSTLVVPKLPLGLAKAICRIVLHHSSTSLSVRSCFFPDLWPDQNDHPGRGLGRLARGGKHLKQTSSQACLHQVGNSFFLFLHILLPR